MPTIRIWRRILNFCLPNWCHKRRLTVITRPSLVLLAPPHEALRHGGAHTATAWTCRTLDFVKNHRRRFLEFLNHCCGAFFSGLPNNVIRHINAAAIWYAAQPDQLCQPLPLVSSSTSFRSHSGSLVPATLYRCAASKSVNPVNAGFSIPERCLRLVPC